MPGKGEQGGLFEQMRRKYERGAGTIKGGAEVSRSSGRRSAAA